MMGGIGSGARRSTHIGDVEDALALDIRALRRLGVVRPGECVCDTICWTIGGLSTSRARLRVDFDDIARGGIMTIVGDMPDGAITKRIAVEAVRAGFGGWRCYFVCPVTARRCEVLYYAGGRFASREAQRLSYSTQNMTDLSRVRRRVSKLRGRLCGSAAQPRPRGPNRIEIAESVHEAEREAKAMYRERLSAAVKRSATRRIPGNR